MFILPEPREVTRPKLSLKKCLDSKDEAQRQEHELQTSYQVPLLLELHQIRHLDKWATQLQKRVKQALPIQAKQK
jgi:hypothetical protein